MAHAIVTSFVPIIDTNGVPINGARVYVYEAGTTTLKTIYSNAALSTPADNPITVGARGMHAIRYVAAGTYKIAVTTSDGTAITDYSWDNIDSGVAVGSGALPIASGGTSATSAAAARTALSVPSASEVATIASDVATLQADLTGTDATQLAAGTTAQRPVSPSAGQVRQNSTTTKFEGYISAGYDNFMLETASATSTANVQAETAEATYIRPDRLKYSERVIKAWGFVTVSGSTPTLVDGFNVSSTITDNGAGDFTFSFTNALPDANYAIVATPYGTGSGMACRIDTITAKSTTVFRIVTFNTATGTATDNLNFSFMIIGSGA